MDKYIAILEDCPERVERMVQVIKESNIPVKIFFSPDAFAMIEWLARNKSKVVLISLDHDLELIAETAENRDPGSGQDVADYLSSEKPFCPIIIHTSNYFGREMMKYKLLEKKWLVSIVMPTPEADWINSDWISCVCSLIKNI